MGFSLMIFAGISLIFTNKYYFFITILAVGGEKGAWNFGVCFVVAGNTFLAGNMFLHIIGNEIMPKTFIFICN